MEKKWNVNDATCTISTFVDRRVVPQYFIGGPDCPRYGSAQIRAMLAFWHVGERRGLRKSGPSPVQFGSQVSASHLSLTDRVAGFAAVGQPSASGRIDAARQLSTFWHLSPRQDCVSGSASSRSALSTEEGSRGWLPRQDSSRFGTGYPRSEHTGERVAH
jgi:hypothetical protein